MILLYDSHISTHNAKVTYAVLSLTSCYCSPLFFAVLGVGLRAGRTKEGNPGTAQSFCWKHFYVFCTQQSDHNCKSSSFHARIG